MPHLALPTLTAFLRRQGLSVQQRDLNIEVYDRLLTRAALLKAIDRLRQELKRKQLARTSEERSLMRWAIQEGPGLAKTVEESKSVLRSELFYMGIASLGAYLALEHSLRILSLAYAPSTLDFAAFQPAHAVDSSRSLLFAVQDLRTNPFIEDFTAHVLPDLRRDPPDIIGISIPTQGQMLAAMTLAHLVKQAGLPSHVTVGGPHITMLREQLPAAPRLFALIDSAVIGAGELPLLRLAEALDAKSDLGAVPNLIYRDPLETSAPRVLTSRAMEPLKEPARTSGKLSPGQPDSPVENCDVLEPEETLPDFDGLPLDLYLSPRRVLPLATSHGCYHGKCGFCNVGYGWESGSGQYRQQPPEQVARQMLALKEKYGAQHIFFADEAISPRTLRELPPLLEAQGSPIEWCGCVRFDRPLTKEVLEGMARGGCRMLLFGLETASEAMSKHMEKGVTVENMGRILEESAQAGIWNHVFFFFGFPGETMENAQETVNFLYAHPTSVHSASPGTFLLERFSPAHQFPSRFGLREIIEDPQRDLAIYFDYKPAYGMDEEMADLLVSHLLSVIPDKSMGHYYTSDAYRLLYASALNKQGSPLPPWLAEEEK